MQSKNEKKIQHLIQLAIARHLKRFEKPAYENFDIHNVVFPLQRKFDVKLPK